jgi:hypothetical protein
MNAVNLAAYVRELTSNDDTTLPDTELLVLLNVAKDDIAPEIAKVNEDIFGMEYLRNLEAGKREYSFPSDIMNNIKAVEAKIDGTSWARLNEFDLNSDRRPTDEPSIIANSNGRSARFDIFRNSLWIYSGTPIVDVTDGLKMYAIQWPANLVDVLGTDDLSEDPTPITCGMPRQFHELWGRRASMVWKGSRQAPIPLSEREQRYDVDLRQKLDAISGMNLDRTNAVRGPHDTGHSY